MDNRIVRAYHLVVSSTQSGLTEEVNFRIDHGFQPFGSGYYNSAGGYYCQPMVTYED